MIDISPQLITIIMMGGVLVGIFLGYPLAIPIGAVGLIMGYFLFGDRVVELYYIRIVGILTSHVLLAVPLFIYMGVMLERSGIAERMYSALYLFLGGFRGGLAIVTVIVGTVIAATIGVFSASVTMLTLVALPSMVNRGYSKSLASGAVAAGGGLGILIPPSVMLVLYGPMANLSVGKLFFAAFFPGFILSFLYCGYIAIRSLLQPQIAPAVPAAERAIPFRKKATFLATSLVPPGILIMSVLGVIYLGIAPPTEAAGCGALAATLLAIGYRKFSWQVLLDSLTMTFKVCGFGLLIGAMAFGFVGVFIAAGGGDVMKDLILATPGGRWGAFGMIMFIIFILGMFIDWIGIVFIMVPIITPIGAALGFDPIWFALMVCINFQTAFLTPPMAPSIFLVKGAADPALGVTMGDVIRGVYPFVILVLIGLTLFAIFPQIILWLPSTMMK
jgi:tripartite ATP-independent transporter DctM subunit